MPQDDEAAFRTWYGGHASKLGLSPDPDDPKHFYDWRAAFKAGATPDKDKHWPSTFKRPGHPALIVDGKDTRTGLDPTIPDLIRHKATIAGIPPELALAVAEQESSFNPTAIGPKLPDGQQAIGTFQILPSTAKARGFDPADPMQNIEGGVGYLRELLDQHKGDLNQVLRTYGGVKTNTTYVPQVLGRIGKFGTPSAPAQTPAAATSAKPDQPTASTAATPPPKPGFLQGLRETTIPTWDEASALGLSLVNRPLGTARDLAAGVLSSQWDQAKQAGTQALKAIRAPFGGTEQKAAGLEAVGRAGAALLPVVGPMAAKAGEAFGKGETAYGAGQAVGILGPPAVGKALRGIRPSKVAPGGIPLTRGERTGSALSRFAESLVEKTVPGKGRFQQFRARQQQAIIGAADLAIEKVSTIMGLPGETYQLGQRAITAIDEAKEAFKAPINQRYGEITRLTETETKRIAKVTEEASQAGLVDEFGRPVTIPKRTMVKTEVGGLQPETRGLRQFAIPLLRRVREEAKLVPADQLKPVIEHLERIAKAPKRLSYQAFQDTRSDLLAIARRHGDPIPGKAGGLAQKLAAITDRAMEEAAVGSGLQVQTATGSVPLQQFVRETNKLWVEAEQSFNDSILAKMAEQAPERMHLLVEQATIDDLSKMKKFLPHRRLQELKATVLDKWLRSDIQGEPIVAGVKGLPESTPSTSMQGGTLRKKVEVFGQDRMEALFGKTEAAELLSVAKIAEQISTRRGESAAGLIAGGINYSLITAGPVATLALAFGNFGGAASALGVAGAAGAGLHFASRLMTRPEGIIGIRKYLHALGAGRTAEAAQAAKALATIYARIDSEDGQEPTGATPPPVPRSAGPTGPPQPANVR